MRGPSFTRRTALAAVAALALLPRQGSGASGTAGLLSVRKSPSCGCCAAWVDLAEAAGFRTSVEDTEDYAGMKRAAGVPLDLLSCHTATIDGYVIEGHVPFAAIRRLLSDRPDISGLAVPGMPAGSPGMGGGMDAEVPVIAWGGSAGDGAPFAFAADET